MSRNLIFKAALPMALVSGSLFGQEVFELHGYMRAGVGRSSNGGEQVTFVLPNTGTAPTGGPGYRLGNETDNYIELAMDVRAYQKGSTAFKLHFRPTFRQYYAARDASSDAGGNVDHSMMPNNNQQVYIREAWGEATGIFGSSGPFASATLWAGRRFYMRQDLHIRDMWYWNNSGDGVGIEGIDFGFGKFAYAFIQHDLGNVSGDWDGGLGGNAGHWPGSVQVDQYNRKGTVVGTHDLRLSDLKLWEGASLTLGFEYNDSRSKKSVENPGNSNVGVRYHAMLTHGLGWGDTRLGDNRIYATYGTGSTFWNWYNPDVKTSNNWHEVMDIFYLKPMKGFEMQGCLIYRKQNMDSNKAPDWTTNTWYSAGIRPTYFFTKHFSVAYEIGYDQLKFDNEKDYRHLNKQTVAVQWSPQANFWSRPSIRLFVTKGSWNNAANNWGPVDAGQFSGENKTKGYTYGAQIEAWW